MITFKGSSARQIFPKQKMSSIKLSSCCQTVHSPLFFRKIVEIERSALRVAISHECQNYLGGGGGFLFLLCVQQIVCPFIPRETSELFRHFLLTTKTTLPHLRVFSVNSPIIWQFAARLTSFFTYRKILPNLVNNSLL